MYVCLIIFSAPRLTINRITGEGNMHLFLSEVQLRTRVLASMDCLVRSVCELDTICEFPNKEDDGEETIWIGKPWQAEAAARMGHGAEYSMSKRIAQKCFEVLLFTIMKFNHIFK
jgi:hypothetical protein